MGDTTPTIRSNNSTMKPRILLMYFAALVGALAAASYEQSNVIVREALPESKNLDEAQARAKAAEDKASAMEEAWSLAEVEAEKQKKQVARLVQDKAAALEQA